MQNKILKSQFNDMCIAGLILDMNSVSIYTGTSKNTAVEITPDGIHIQPGLGNAMILSTYDVKGPLYKQTMPPADYLPGLANFTSRKTFDLPIVKQAGDLAVACSAYATLAGVL